MINCIIVDDEPLALDVMENYIQRVPNLKLLKRCSDALEAYDTLQNEKVDLMFLDIQMPQLTGVDFLRSLHNPPMVVFTTAFSNFALEGYALSVIDYLLKPIAFDRFVQAVNKATEYMQLKNHDQPKEEEIDFMFVKSDQKLVKINYSEILFIEALADYVKIHTAEKRIVTLQTMKNLEEKLSKNKFVRVHRSYIIPLERVQAINGNTIEIQSHSIPIGKNYKEEFFKILEQSNYLK
jgi:DNA-binding LytR/AlgR family response regulator